MSRFQNAQRRGPGICMSGTHGRTHLMVYCQATCIHVYACIHYMHSFHVQSRKHICSAEHYSFHRINTMLTRFFKYLCKQRNQLQIHTKKKIKNTEYAESNHPLCTALKSLNNVQRQIRRRCVTLHFARWKHSRTVFVNYTQIYYSQIYDAFDVQNRLQIQPRDTRVRWKRWYACLCGRVQHFSKCRKYSCIYFERDYATLVCRYVVPVTT